MARWIIRRALTGLLIVLFLVMLGCTHSEQNVAGFWASKDMILRISREGENGEHYTVEWKEPSKLARGSFSSSFRNGRIPGDPIKGDMTYLGGHLFWRGQEFRRAVPEEYYRAAPK
jgi:hypothetical protein